MNHQEKNEAREIVVSNAFTKRLDNFWYHHKWKVIIITFFVVVFSVCFAQCGSKQDSDVTLTFAGGYTLSQAEASSVREIFSTLARKHTSIGEGKAEAVLAELVTYPIYTEAELKAKYTDENGTLSDYSYRVAVNANTDRLNALKNYMMTGQCSIWLVNSFVYEEQSMGARLAKPLSEIFGEEGAPVPTYDAYAVRLGDTALYQYYSALQVLPADTLVVLTQRFVMGASADEAYYEQCTDLFRAILSFEAPQ